jgi:DNA-nicking Smr family endonuclease
MAPMAKPKPFHNPFRGLKLKQAEPEPQKAAPKKAPPPPRVAHAPPPVVQEEDEAALFRALIGDVEPVRGGPQIIPPPPPPAAERRRIVDEEEEALDVLCELVAGSGPFDVADSDEYIEGAVAGLDNRILRRLRRGDYAVQAHLDLHGLTRSEAKQELTAFVDQSCYRGYRCVLVVHGRGLHSKDQIPVLKESVQGWLSRGGIAQRVLAFTTARPHDGGAGAVYVLLRR